MAIHSCRSTNGASVRSYHFSFTYSVKKKTTKCRKCNCIFITAHLTFCVSLVLLLLIYLFGHQCAYLVLSTHSCHVRHYILCISHNKWATHIEAGKVTRSARYRAIRNATYLNNCIRFTHELFFLRKACVS